MGCAGVLSVWLVTKCRRIKFRLRVPHLMELKSFFSPLTMDRKAPCAESEGKVSCKKRLTRRLALTRLYRERAFSGQAQKAQIRGLYNLFCWHSRLGLCSASEPIESGRGADVQKPRFQMFVGFESVQTHKWCPLSTFARLVACCFGVLRARVQSPTYNFLTVSTSREM